MKFTPKTEQEIVEDGLIPDKTICDFEVLRGEDKQSKAGNEMIVLTLNVFHNDASGRSITDYLVSTMEFKLRQAADACGLLAQYEKGELVAEDFEGKSGKCVVAIDKGSVDYPLPKNVIKSYVKRSAAPAAKGELPAGFDDSVGF